VNFNSTNTAGKNLQVQIHFETSDFYVHFSKMVTPERRLLYQHSLTMVMKYETVHNTSTGLPQSVTLPKIGFGMWQIGGGSYPDPNLDSVSTAALHAALETGYTHFDTAESYASGHSEELLGRAIRETNTNREDVFVTTKVSPEHLRHADILRSCENSLRRLKMDYIDLYLIHWPGTWTDYEETFGALNQLVRDGKLRHLGVSNFNLKLLKQARQLSETPILTDQVPYRLPDRTYVENGVLAYCQQNDILLTAYSPLKFRNLTVNKTLQVIANAHSATPYQIALAWLAAQRRVITIPMSRDPQHIHENFVAADIELSQEEFQRLSGLW
jgi:diketogulonate reductase-like aldo/keto reductase